MTTSIFNAAAVPALRAETDLAEPRLVGIATQETAKRRHTLASRLVFLTVCVALAATTLAYGTVHYWALAIFSLSAAGIVCLWSVDGIVLRSTQISLNSLQLPLLGAIALALIQLLPLRAPDAAGLPVSPARTLSLDPYSTRLFIIQFASLLIYFAAVLVFTDTPRRLRTLAHTIIIFGFLLAMFGLMQSFTSDPDVVYWFRKLPQSTAFGPFINRHHFAAYMELALAIPLGLVFTGAVESQKRPLYIFAAALMGVALIMTNSRGGIIAVGAEIFFLFLIAGPGSATEQPKEKRLRAALMRGGLAFALVIALIVGALALGGPDIFSRLLGTPTASDPTQGRAHFWSVTLDIIKNYPIVGSGLGSYGVIYTRYDSRNGAYRLEQAHNDYLQTLSDAGIIGAVLGATFLVLLFRKGLARRQTNDSFRRGVSTGALAGCFAVLIHSLFDFPLHTTANALLFLILAALATQDSRVDQSVRRRRRRRRSRSQIETFAPAPQIATEAMKSA